MLEDHDKFIDEVIKKAINADAQSKINELRDTKEALTVEALADVSGLSKSKIKKIMEETRDSKTEGKEIRIFKNSNPFGIFLFIIVIAMPFIINFISDKPNNYSENEPTALEKSEMREKHSRLITAIRENDLPLVRHLITEEKIPLYLDERFITSRDNYDPLRNTYVYNNYNMTKLLLEFGADPLYNISNFSNNTYYAAQKNDNFYITMIFNHLVKLESTPASIKKLWEMHIPYTRHGLFKAYKEDNFEALAMFKETNTGKYSQFWVERTLEYVIKNHLTADTEKLFDLFIIQETNPKKKVDLASVGMMLSEHYRFYEFIDRFYNAGADPNSSRGIKIDFHGAKSNLFVVTALQNYHSSLNKMLEAGYELNDKQSKQILKHMFSERWKNKLLTIKQPSTTYQNFNKTIKVLADYGVNFTTEDIQNFASKVVLRSRYISDYNEKLKEWTEVLAIITKNVDTLPFTSEFISTLAIVKDTKNIKYLVESGVSITDSNIITAIQANALEQASYLLNSLTEKKRENFEAQFRSKNALKIAEYIENERKSGYSKEQMSTIFSYMIDKNLFPLTSGFIRVLIKAHDTKNIKYLVESGVPVTGKLIALALRNNALEQASYLLGSLKEKERERMAKSFHARSGSYGASYFIVKDIAQKRSGYSNEEALAIVNYMKNNKLIGDKDGHTHDLITWIQTRGSSPKSW